MKRANFQRRLYFFRRRRRIERRRKKDSTRDRRKNPRLPIGYIRIQAPAVFSLDPGSRNQLLLFLGEIREKIVKDKSPVQIDFTITKKMIAGGTLLFSAELRRCLTLAKGKARINCKPPRDAKVAQVLKQIGVFDLIGYRKRIQPKFSDVVHWRYASGHMVEGEKYENILGSYEGRIADTLLSRLFTGITEAMTNCHHHAYIKIRDDGLEIKDDKKFWWMFSQESNGYISVVFCDLGVGIPTTLPIKKPALWQQIFTLGKAGSDGSIIEKSIESSISRTGKKYRGKGLHQLLDAIRSHPSGAIKIFSNRGCYTFSNGKASIRDYPDSIMGTLIQWKVPIVQGNLFHESAHN